MAIEEQPDHYHYTMLGIAVAMMLLTIKRSKLPADEMFLHDFLDRLEISNPDIMADLAPYMADGTF